MIDYVAVQRIEEGMRTQTKADLPKGYYARGDYIQLLMTRGWSAHQIQVATGWNMNRPLHGPNSYITHAAKVHVEGIGKGTNVPGAPDTHDEMNVDGVVIHAGPLKIALEGSLESITEVAHQIIRAAEEVKSWSDPLDMSA